MIINKSNDFVMVFPQWAEWNVFELPDFKFEFFPSFVNMPHASITRFCFKPIP